MAREIRNGVPAAQLPDAVWRKSSRSGAVGNCVEFAWAEREVVAVRNSRNPGGPVLVYAREELVAFLADVRKREG